MSALSSVRTWPSSARSSATSALSSVRSSVTSALSSTCAFPTSSFVATLSSIATLICSVTASACASSKPASRSALTALYVSKVSMTAPTLAKLPRRGKRDVQIRERCRADASLTRPGRPSCGRRCEDGSPAAGRWRSDLDADRVFGLAVWKTLDLTSVAASRVPDRFRARHPSVRLGRNERFPRPSGSRRIRTERLRRRVAHPPKRHPAPNQGA